MAGRGRGRGRGLSINVEALGLGRADVITPIIAQPPPLYPPLQSMPVPLSDNSDLEYMFALKQEMRESYKKSPFYISAPKKTKDIERYSDKYQPEFGDVKLNWAPDWTRLPSELRDGKKRKMKTSSKSANKAPKMMKDDVTTLLDNLEKTATISNADEEDDAEEEGDDAAKKKDDELNEDEEEEYEDEDLEEETDYNLAYFDNGEGYGDDDDDDDEGPTY